GLPRAATVLHRWLNLQTREKCSLFWIVTGFECKIPARLRPKFSSRLRYGRRVHLQVLDGGGPLVAQMNEQDVAEFAAGAAAQRFQDGLMLAHRFAPSLALAGEVGG